MSTQINFPDLPVLPQSRYENIFNIYLDDNKNYFYNLLQTIIIPSNLPDGYFDTYQVEPEDTLPFISYKLYKRTDLWWVIATVNNINNPTITLEPMTKLKVPTQSVVRTIVSQL